MMDQTPSIGRIVHFFDAGLKGLGVNGEGPYAAIITTVHSPTCVNLDGFPAGQIGEQTSVCLGTKDSGMSSRWEWPARA